MTSVQQNLNASQGSFIFKEAGSVVNSKAAELGSKIGILHQNQEFSKQEKQSHVNDKLYILEAKVKHLFVSEEDEQAQVLKEQLNRLIDNNNGGDLEGWNEENTLLLKQVQAELAQNIQNFSQNKKQLDQKMSQNIDEQFYHLQLESQKNDRLYEESRTNKISEVKQNVSLLKDLILQEKLKREEGFQSINSQIISIIDDLKTKYRQQQKAKENSYNSIFNEITQVNQILTNEIKNETKEREHVVESLFKTLEDLSMTYGKKYRN